MAPPIAYSGALPPKKKSELQEIAVALKLSNSGTKDELQVRIKKHLDINQDALEDDPTFAGLFGRRKRSLQPQPTLLSGRFAPSTSEIVEKPKSSSSRRITALDPIGENTPVKDLHDVSMFLKDPLTPIEVSANYSSRQIEAITPSSLPPLPPSPTKSLISHLPKASELKAVVQCRQQEIIQNGHELLTATRIFLSNSRNIWSLTAIFELLCVISIIIPWRILQIPLSARNQAGPLLSIPYPPWSIFQTAAFWQVILHWAIPTLIIPAFVGSMVSFNPANKPSPTRTPSAVPIAPFDPLTASIIRLAAQVGYPYAFIASCTELVGLDVLGSNWRVLSASVGVAFAFAEAIAGAPQIFAKTLIREQRLEFNSIEDEVYSPPLNRRALMAEDETPEDETD